MPTSKQQRLAEMIRRARCTIIITGAGLSTSSGIPDFRSAGGLWTQVDPMKVAHIDVWRTDPARFWQFYRHRLDIPDHFEPNAGHRAIVKLVERGLVAGVVTQNIDGLQQKAGLDDIVEIHGSVRHLICVCGFSIERTAGLTLFADNGVPYCPNCQQPLKPDVVLFGEMLDEQALARAYGMAYACDLMICVGSSLQVYPVAELPQYAQAGGAQLAIISHDSAYDHLADVRLTGDIAEELPGVVSALDQFADAAV
jgi:NAD-dependent deacetylase